jgi:hypothetical protein
MTTMARRSAKAKQRRRHDRDGRQRRREAEAERLRPVTDRQALEAEEKRVQRQAQAEAEWKHAQELEAERKAERPGVPVPRGLDAAAQSRIRDVIAKVELQAHRSRWRFGWRLKVRALVSPWKWRPLWENLGPIPATGPHAGEVYRAGFLLGPFELRRWSATAMDALRDRRRG